MSLTVIRFALSKSVTKSEISHHSFQLLDLPNQVCEAEMLLNPGRRRLERDLTPEGDG